MPRGGARPNAGRKKGTPNKVTKLIKDAIIDSFQEVGGVKYLVELAQTDPKAYASLLGKVLPTQITGEDGGPVKTQTQIIFEPVGPDDEN